MNLTSRSVIKNLLESHQIQPSKRLGQNFLVDKGAVRKIIEAADLQPDDIVLEIGPGPGVLTQELAKKAKRVVAMEKDPKIVEILKETMSGYNNVEIIRGDILRCDFSNSKFEARNSKQYQNSNDQNSKRDDFEHLNLENLNLFRISDFGFRAFKVVGNLPFYLTAHLIRQLLEWLEVGPLTILFVVQKEVAQRICAKPPDMNLLAVSVQFYAEPKIISYISKKSFWPSPKVDAAIIKITPYKEAAPHQYLRYGAGLREQFFKIVRSGFSQPRKQLRNNLSKGLKLDKNKVGEWLLANGIQPTQRAETLSIDDWIKVVINYPK